MSIIRDTLKNPQILRAKKHILLLSHMRAYTSLFGHILGSHAEIEGYYEMHIGYHSWKSLIRQKQQYYKEHKHKPSAHYLFDKVLHNEHHVSSNLLLNKNVIPLFSLRAPEETIPSILSLYQKVNPTHQFNNIEFATNYYIARLEHLSNLASKIPNQFYYLDAKMLVTNSSVALKKLSDILQLNSDLLPEYKNMEKTGKGNSGDHSNELKTGEIQNAKKEYDKNILPQELFEQAQETYLMCRNSLMSQAILSIN